MLSKQFVNGLLASVIDENMALYVELLRTSDRKSASDQYWLRVFELFDGLAESERLVLFEIMRQVAVDTTSNILGILDGTSYIEGLDEELSLVCGSQRLSGDLQDEFLSACDGE